MHGAGSPSFEDGGVDVGLAANRRRIAQVLRNHFHCFCDACGQRPLGTRLRQRLGSQEDDRPERRAPGAKILRREIVTHGFLEVRVHLIRVDLVSVARIVDVLK